MNTNEYRALMIQFGCIPGEGEDLSYAERIVRQCKIETIEACEKIRKLVDQVERRTKGIPEKVDSDMFLHSAHVAVWRNNIRYISIFLERESKLYEDEVIW